MRFRSAALVAVLLTALPALATPDAAKSAIEARLRTQLPTLTRDDYLLGPAAFDPQLRAAAETAGEAARPVLEQGKAIWMRKFKDGRTIATCFPNGGRRVGATYPQYRPSMKRVFTLEMAVNQCLRLHKEPQLDFDDPATMGALTAYLRSLSADVPIAVRVPSLAERDFDAGQRMYFTRMGQRNFACASCHLQGAGHFYGDTPLSPAIGQAARWPYLRRTEAMTLQAQIRECLQRMGAAPFPAGSEELNDLEYFLTYLSNGLPLRPNAPHLP